MLLKNPISTTKRFFQRALGSFKNLLSGGEGPYQRLPKTPLFDPFSCARKTRHPQNSILPKPEEDEFKEEKQVSSPPKSPVQRSEGERPRRQRRRRMDETRDAKMCLVANKLKEMEIVDKSNADHLFDIEEVLHYYSRLTCPAYLDIVDGFFTELYAEFFNAQQQFQLANI